MRMKPNYVLDAVRQGRIATGVAVQFGAPEVVESAGAAGYEFVYIDCEHGSFFIDTAVEMIRAADAVGTTPVVRVPGQDPSYITRMLDAGAMGVIVPNVNTAAQAKAIAAAAKYKMGNNGGMRGACPGTRASWHQTMNWPEFVKWSNESTMLWPLIESPEGAENIEAIMDVPGIDAIMLGQFDFAHALGFPGQTQHPDVTRRYTEVVRKAKAAKKMVVGSLFSATPEEMRVEKRHWMELGVRIFVAGSDRRMLVNAMRTRIAAVREA